MILEDVKEKWKDCTLCKNSQTDVKIFGAGKRNAQIALIGEGPGREEVLQKTPFVGPAGQLLDKILDAIGFRREDLYYTNSVICRTDDKNRTPNKSECLNCRERLFEEISAVSPKYIILVGSIALRTVLGEDYKIMNTHGQWITTLQKPCYFYFSMLHPAWILHSSTPEETKAKKVTMWKDAKELKRTINIMNESFMSKG